MIIPDHTADKVRLLQTEFGGRLFWKIEKRSGFGTAYVHGFKWALENKYDFILKWMLIFLTIQMT
jgi:dolichol-phosphate mannosyltransferase